MYHLSANDPWPVDLKSLWEWLQAEYTVKEHGTCHIHIHVSKEGGFLPDDVKKVAICVMIFEPAILAIEPEHLRSDEYAKSIWANNNRISAYYGPGPLCSKEDTIKKLMYCKTVNDVVADTNPNRDRNWAWNFRNLMTDPIENQYLSAGNRPIGTIEFRQAPTCTTLEDVLQWTEFATSFVQAATHRGSTVAGQYPSDSGKPQEVFGKCEHPKRP